MEPLTSSAVLKTWFLFLAVVIDRRDDKNASTGAFEMIFKQNCPPIPPYLGMSLSIKGKKVYRPSSDQKAANKKSKMNHSSDTLVDSETDEDTSIEENIVQKRCTTDFMQPIKTLIDTIQGGFSPTDIPQDTTDRPSSSSAEETDSVHYDSDSSEACDSERIIALEGKEMELRKKIDPSRSELDRKLSRIDPKMKKEDEANRRKKIDWIRKNIEDVRSSKSEKPDKMKEEPSKKLGRNREALDLLISENACPKSCRMESKPKTTHEELEHIFREEIIKMLDTIECKTFMKECPNVCDKVEAMDDVWEPDNVESHQEEPEMEMNQTLCEDLTSFAPLDELKEEPSERVADVEIVEEPSQGEPNISILDADHQSDAKLSEIDEKIEPTERIDLTDNNMSLLSISDFTDYDFEETDRTTGNNGISNENLHIEAVESLIDFDSKFEKELKELEVKEANLKEKLDMTGGLTIMPQGLLLKKKTRGMPRWNNTKTSMEYFREWKYKVDETRRTCEDMLAKLRVFKEANSKLKFHDALRKRMEDEAQFIKRLKQFRTTKNFVKMNKNMARRRMARSNNDEEQIREETYSMGSPKEFVAEFLSATTSERTAKVMALCKQQAIRYNHYYDRNRKNADADARFAVRLFECDLPTTDPPLAINSESGAVRNVNQTLPKIKQRNRPLLPNGSSGNGRKIDAVTEKMIRKKLESRVK